MILSCVQSNQHTHFSTPALIYSGLFRFAGNQRRPFAFLNHRAKTMDAWGYCVFGQVVEGMDVVNKIKAVATTYKGGHQDVPVEDVVIESAEIA